jgi:hypothetical protein
MLKTGLFKPGLQPISCRDARSGRPPSGWKIIRMENRYRGSSGIGPMRVADAQTGRPYSGPIDWS